MDRKFIISFVGDRFQSAVQIVGLIAGADGDFQSPASLERLPLRAGELPTGDADRRIGLLLLRTAELPFILLPCRGQDRGEQFQAVDVFIARRSIFSRLQQQEGFSVTGFRRGETGQRNCVFSGQITVVILSELIGLPRIQVTNCVAAAGFGDGLHFPAQFIGYVPCEQAGTQAEEGAFHMVVASADLIRQGGIEEQIRPGAALIALHILEKSDGGPGEIGHGMQHPTHRFQI